VATVTIELPLYCRCPRVHGPMHILSSTTTDIWQLCQIHAATLSMQETRGENCAPGTAAAARSERRQASLEPSTPDVAKSPSRRWVINRPRRSGYGLAVTVIWTSCPRPLASDISRSSEKSSMGESSLSNQHCDHDGKLGLCQEQIRVGKTEISKDVPRAGCELYFVTHPSLPGAKIIQ
jgi:hypothetical protein